MPPPHPLLNLWSSAVDLDPDAMLNFQSSIGAACLHACVRLGYFEGHPPFTTPSTKSSSKPQPNPSPETLPGTLAFLNYHVPVDAPDLQPPASSGSLRTALMEVICITPHMLHLSRRPSQLASSDLPLSTVLDIAGLLLSRGAASSFLQGDTASAAVYKHSVAISRMIRASTVDNIFQPNFVSALIH